MNIARLFPKTLFGRFFLISVFSLLVFCLLVLPLTNTWRNQALLRNIAANESRLFLTYVRLLDRLPFPAERDGLFNPADDMFSIQVSKTPPKMHMGQSAYSLSLKERLEQAFGQEHIRYLNLLVCVQVCSFSGHEDGNMQEPETGVSSFLFYQCKCIRTEIAFQRTDGVWISAVHRVEVLSQASLWVRIAIITLEFILVAGGVALSLLWLLRPLKDLVAATEQFAQNKAFIPLKTDRGPVEIREATAAFNRMFLSIRQAFEERERFLTSFSHDLRTPLTRLRLRLEQVEQEELREKLCADVDVLKNTLNSTITFLRSERNKDEVRLPVPVMPLLQALVEDRRSIGECVSLSGESSAVLQSWPESLRNGFENVVDNALRYADCSDIHVYDEKGADGKTWLHIDFLDNGPGIPEDKLELVLEPYVRLERSRNPGTGGHGLGLSIVRNIVRESGGHLYLCNRAEGGLLVRMLFPV